MIQDIKLVLFDLDNTLFSFDSYYKQATKNVFYTSSITKHLPFEKFFSHYHHYDHHFWRLHDQGHISLDEVRQQRLICTLKHFDQELSAEDADNYFSKFFNHFIHLLKPDETLNAYLCEFKKTYQVGIITNGKVYEQRAKLRKLNLHKVFTDREIFISEEMKIEKPKSEAFHIPLSYYGIEPKNAVYLNDLTALGLTNTYIFPHYDREDLFPDPVGKTIEDRLQTFETLNTCTVVRILDNQSILINN